MQHAGVAVRRVCAWVPLRGGGGDGGVGAFAALSPIRAGGAGEANAMRVPLFEPIRAAPGTSPPASPTTRRGAASDGKSAGGGGGGGAAAGTSSSPPPMVVAPMASSGRASALQHWMQWRDLKAFQRRCATSPPADAAPPPEAPSDGREEHLVVLVHGLVGTPADMDYLHKLLWEACEEQPSLRLLVHAPEVNLGRTHDGVAGGGARVAGDILAVVRRRPSLRSISLVGFSLGGIYARYAAALLYERAGADGASATAAAGGGGTIAGLRPRSFITVASPHLGVRGFGVYRFVHDNLKGPLARVFAGATGAEMMLADGGGDGAATPLLAEMTEDRAGRPYMSALAAFEQRVLYGNVQNDFMVAFGSAVLDPRARAVKMGRYAPPAGAEIIDHAVDSRGCRVWFRSQITPESAPPPPPTPPPPPKKNNAELERVMAQRLRSVGWQSVGVLFPKLLPVAHNLIMSKMRTELEWLLFTHTGARAVRHVAQSVLRHELGDDERAAHTVVQNAAAAAAAAEESADEEGAQIDMART